MQATSGGVPAVTSTAVMAISTTMTIEAGQPKGDAVILVVENMVVPFPARADRGIKTPRVGACMASPDTAGRLARPVAVTQMLPASDMPLGPISRFSSRLSHAQKTGFRFSGCAMKGHGSGRRSVDVWLTRELAAAILNVHAQRVAAASNDHEITQV
ncbi:hypothetical protein AB0H94_34905 [Streptomyces purpurascens]|uniref:hypothetical protein n=1 Tax=Streptomyces purpurascens TaxID=1924 RepID=UPI0034029907